MALDRVKYSSIGQNKAHKGTLCITSYFQVLHQSVLAYPQCILSPSQQRGAPFRA